MANIIRGSGGGTGGGEGDLPPLHANMAMTVAPGQVTITMDDMPEEYKPIWGKTILVLKYDSAPESVIDGDEIITIMPDGSIEG